MKLLLKWVLLLKGICSRGEQILLFRSRPFSEARQNNVDRVTSPESVSIPLHIIWPMKDCSFSSICKILYTCSCQPANWPRWLSWMRRPTGDQEVAGSTPHAPPPRGRQHSFVEIDHEIFSTVILSLLLIQEGQLSVSGERMCTILVNHLED